MVEIKQISEREVMVGESRIYLGEDDILYWDIVGETTEEIVIAMYKAVFTLADYVEKEVNVLVNLNKAGKSSHKARKIGNKYLECEIFDKIVYFGLSPVARVIASFFMGVTKKKNMRFFKTKEEALAWLKEDSNE